MNEGIRDTISSLLNEAYCPDILNFCKRTSQWSWKTKEGRENNRRNVYTIIFKGSSLLVVAGDMLDEKDACRLGFEKRPQHAEKYINGPNWNWEIELDRDNIINIVNSVIEILTNEYIQESINRFC